MLEQFAKEVAGRVKVAKLNVGEQPAAAGVFQVRGVPTLLLFEKGKEKSRQAGFMPIAALRKFVG